MGVRQEVFRLPFLYCPPDGFKGSNEFGSLVCAARNAGYTALVQPDGDTDALEVRVGCDVRRCHSPSELWAAIRDTVDVTVPQRLPSTYVSGDGQEMTFYAGREQIAAVFVSSRARDVHKWMEALTPREIGFKSGLYIVGDGNTQMMQVTGYVPRECLTRCANGIMYAAAREVGERWLRMHAPDAKRIARVESSTGAQRGRRLDVLTASPVHTSV